MYRLPFGRNRLGLVEVHTSVFFFSFLLEYVRDIHRGRLLAPVSRVFRRTYGWPREGGVHSGHFPFHRLRCLHREQF